MGVKLVQLAKGKIIGTGDVHLEELIPVDEDVPTSYVQKWDISEGANDRVTAYLTGTSPSYSLHVYGSGRMKDYQYDADGAYPYITAPWAKYLFPDTTRISSHIRNVHIHNGVTNIASCFLAGDAFAESYKSTFLQTVIIADTVREIGAYAFCCNVPQQIVIPQGVRKIGNSAFAATWSSTAKNVPISCAESVNYTDINAFYGTQWWQDTSSVFKSIGDGCIVKYNGSGSTITIPDGTKSLVLWNTPATIKESVSSINLPSTLKALCISALNGFNRLVEITLPESLRIIARNALKDCNSLSQLDIPDGVKEIGINAFSGCTSMRKIFIPKSVKKIFSSQPVERGNTVSAEYSPFRGCSGLTIFCEHESLPAGFESFWNYINDSTQATTVFGSSRSDFSAAT